MKFGIARYYLGWFKIVWEGLGSFGKQFGKQFGELWGALGELWEGLYDDITKSSHDFYKNYFNLSLIYL